MTLRSLVILGFLSIALFAVLPSASAEADGCWYPDAYASETTIVQYGDTGAYLVRHEAGYSPTCDPAQTVPWSTHCASTGTGSQTIYTPPIGHEAITILDQPILPAQTLVPPQPIQLPDDPQATALDDDGCTDFGPGSSNPIAVGIRIESGGASTSIGTDDFEAPTCLDPTAPDFPCTDLVGALLDTVFSGPFLADTDGDHIPDTLWLDSDGDGERAADGSEDAGLPETGPIEPLVMDCQDVPSDTVAYICYNGGGEYGYVLWVGGPIRYGTQL